MSGRERVDFVVGADDVPLDAGDEELAQPSRRPRLPWALAALALVAAVTAVLVEQRHTSRTDAGPSPSPSPSAVVSGTPEPVAATPQLQLPEGNRRPRTPPGCPAGAECYSDTVVPTSTITALRTDFPSAQVTSAASVLANRTGRFGPDLVARLLHARAGSVDITVTVSKPHRADRDAYVHDRTGALLHSRDTYAGTAFTVTVEIVQLGPKHRPSHAALDRIAHDHRLVVPQ